MGQLTDLPDELLSDVVERISNDDRATLESISLTCKRLQRIAGAFQWAHVVLPWRLNKKSPITRFIETHQGDARVRSIRLRPQSSVLNAFKVGMKNAHDHMDALCGNLHTLSRLTTFSIFLDGEVDSRCYFPGPVLARIVRSLPSSLLHLELDTECIDRISQHDHSRYGDDHLCTAIGDHMPRLETLRLRISCLCTDLFRSISSATPSKLRRALICLSTSHGNESRLAIDADVGDCAIPRPSGQRRRGHSHGAGHGTLSAEKITRHLLDLSKNDAFPALQRFILWASGFRDIPRNYCSVRDFATGTSTHYPILSCPNLLRLDPPDLMGGQEWSEIYTIRDHNGQDWVGAREEIEKAVLHEVNWMEEFGGMRLPPSGQLGTETRLHEERLLSWDYVYAKEAERLRAETHAVASRLPDTSQFAMSAVYTSRM